MDPALNDLIRLEIKESIAAKAAMLEDEHLIEQIGQAAHLILSAFRKDGKLFIAGNGGSAADAQHLAAEFVGRYTIDRAGLPCLALTTDTSVLTAVSNDSGFETVLARQLQSLARTGDVFMAISTSGDSANVLAALRQCRKSKLPTIGLSGATGGAMLSLCDICIRVPSTNTARIQECHILIGHMLCAVVEGAFFGDTSH